MRWPPRENQFTARQLEADDKLDTMKRLRHQSPSKMPRGKNSAQQKRYESAHSLYKPNCY